MIQTIKSKKSEKTRIDKFLSDEFKHYSRNFFKNLIIGGNVLVNGKTITPNYLIKKHDEVKININKSRNELVSEQPDFEVLFESPSYMIINKPYNKVVHPGRGGMHIQGTLVNAILDKIKDKDKFPDSLRPGIVHRLDKDTSGLLIIARNFNSYKYFVGLFKKNKIVKKYTTLVMGDLQHDKGIIDSPIMRDPKNRKRMSIGSSETAKNSVTEFKIIDKFTFFDKIYSYLDIRLHTGRTHQIRVHLSAIGHPVVGDKVYGNKKINLLFEKQTQLKRQFLHAGFLQFVDPVTKKTVTYKSKLPADLQRVFNNLK